MRAARLLAAVLAGVFAAGASAADPVPDKDQASKPPPAKKKKKPMHMSEPIANEMKKEGMTKGSVHAAAESKSREMEPMLEEEEKKMPEKKGP
jgi:hypothetical protein